MARPATVGCPCCGGGVGVRPREIIPDVWSAVAHVPLKRVGGAPQKRAAFSDFLALGVVSFLASPPPPTPPVARNSAFSKRTL